MRRSPFLFLLPFDMTIPIHRSCNRFFTHSPGVHACGRHSSPTGLKTDRGNGRGTFSPHLAIHIYIYNTPFSELFAASPAARTTSCLEPNCCYRSVMAWDVDRDQPQRCSTLRPSIFGTPLERRGMSSRCFHAGPHSLT